MFEVIKTISIQFFFTKKFWAKRKGPKCKANDFTLLRSFAMQNIFAFVVFCLLNFVLLVDFGLIYVFVRLKSFPKKRINWLETVLITSFTILLTCPPSIHLSSLYFHAFVCICNHLWESFLFHENYFSIVRTLFYLWELSFICENLCPYENKKVYEYHHLKQILYHRNMTMIFCWFPMFQVCVFYFEIISFHAWLFFC